MSYSIMFAPSYQDCRKTLQGNPTLGAALAEVLAELAEDPLKSPRLKSHRVEKAAGETYSSTVGGQGHRLIWRLIDGAMVLVMLLGPHDAVYRRAEKIRLVYEPNSGLVELREPDPVTGASTPLQEIRSRAGSLFMAYRDSELAAAGLEPYEVDVLRGLDVLEDLDRLRDRMRPESYDRALHIAVDGLPEAPRPEPPAPEAPVEQEALDLGLAQQIKEQPLHAGFVPANLGTLSSIYDQPIEDWMVFLHPDQARAVEVDFRGPARIRGSAGTGKTVVGLHRAHREAQDPEARVLFTTYIRSLPQVFEALYERMPARGEGVVEFINLHAWATRFLKERGRRGAIDPRATAGCMANAWKKVETKFAKTGVTRAYLDEEIQWIIKGRRISSLDEYLALERTGRGTPLDRTQREAAWDLYERYQSSLKANGLLDFGDILLATQDELEREPLDRYTAVIADEAQDLTEVGLRILDRLAPSSKPNGLVLLGDGQQKVYPGGFSLRRIGIDVAGRAVVLRLNYRNSREVLALAQSLIAGEPPASLEDDATGDAVDEAVRRGEAPHCAGYTDVTEHDLALAIAVQDRAGPDSRQAGDLAILVPTNRLVDEYIKAVENLGLRSQKLQDYDGRPNPWVKVGTYQRAKGLEFKHVFLPRLDSDGLGDQPLWSEDATAHQERMSMLRRQLYVATSRARDGVWMGWVGEPSSIIKPAISNRAGGEI